jgi:hypothetical protein
MGLHYQSIAGTDDGRSRDFFLRGSRVKMVEYWPAPFPARNDRKHLVEISVAVKAYLL